MEEGGKGYPYMDREGAPSSFLILDDKEIGVKFNKGVIVKSKMMSRNKIFVGSGNMRDIM
jgi:hypothetical protein